MGSICAKPSFPTKKNIKECAAKCIEGDELGELMDLIQNCVLAGPRDCERLKLDEPIMFKHTVTTTKVPMSALTYALVLGKRKCFQYLYEEAGASLAVMHDQISYLRKKPVDIVIDDCNFDFLDFYLPIHLLYHSEQSLISNTETEDFSISNSSLKPKSRPKHLVTMQSSIHRVVDKGNFKALKYLLDYFDGRKVPDVFNVHSIEEVSGENCALVAVRSGDLEMLRFLHKHCNADFNIRNKRRESAIQVAAAASKKKPKVEFLLIMRFLVEEVGVDLAYNYEETLLLCENNNIIAYLEEKLEALGIFVKKRDVPDSLPQSPCMGILNSDEVAEFQYYERTTVSELIRDEHKKRKSLSTIKRASQDSSFTQDLIF